MSYSWYHEITFYSINSVRNVVTGIDVDYLKLRNSIVPFLYWFYKNTEWNKSIVTIRLNKYHNITQKNSQCSNIYI